MSPDPYPLALTGAGDHAVIPNFIPTRRRSKRPDGATLPGTPCYRSPCRTGGLFSHRDVLTRATLLWALLAIGCDRHQPWNVLLVTFDTTRADHLGCYGHPTIATPNIDRLAAQGVRFDRAYTSVPLTLPAHASLMTGLFPTAHGIRDNGLFVLDEIHTTLAEVLAANGYATAAAVGAFPLVARFGLDQGFEIYDDDLSTPREDYLGQPLPRRRLFFEERSASWVNEALFEWLAKPRRRPFFLWAHYYEPHQPFAPPAPYDQLYSTDPYSGEIATADHSLGVLLGRLQDLGEAERTLVIFTSDHGEGLNDHGEQTHGYLLYDSTLRVPLILRPPGGMAERTVVERVRLVDVMPTVLELLGLPVPENLDGRSLAPFLDNGPTPGPRPHYAETLAPRLGQGWGELRAFYQGHFKYIHGPRPELFDLAADPTESEDLSGLRPELAADLRAQLANFLVDNGTRSASAAVPPDEETRRRLMALGYIQGSGTAAEGIREELRDDGLPPQDRVGDVATIATVRQLLYTGQALPARDEVRALLAADPDNPFYRELLATAELDLGRVDEALPIVERLVTEGTRLGSAEELLLNAGQRLHTAGRTTEGIAAVRRSLDTSASTHGLLLLARMVAEQGESDEPLALLRQALELDPSFVPARIDLAVHLAARGDITGADAAFRLALRQQPYSPRAHYNFGAFLIRQERLELAHDHIRRAIELAPSYSQAHHAQVATLMAQGRQAEAEQKLADWASSAPGDPAVARTRQWLEESR